jgi:drug/metabolite transporter (DMT)-like permease
LLLLLRVLTLGFERPAFKALARDRNTVAATTLTYSLALLLIALVLCLWPAQRVQGFAGMGHWWPYAMASGAVAFAGYNLNMYALGRGEVSLLSPLYSSALVLLYLFEVAMGGVAFSWLSLVAIMLVVSGVSLIDIRTDLSWKDFFNPSKVLRAPGAIAMLASAVLLGIVRLVDRQGASTAPVLAYSLLSTLPVVVLSLALLTVRRLLPEALHLLRTRPSAALGSTAAHTAGYLTLLAAYGFYPASTVEPIGQLSLFVNMYIAALWFQEPVKHRVMPTALVVVGAGLLMYTAVTA